MFGLVRAALGLCVVAVVLLACMPISMSLAPEPTDVPIPTQTATPTPTSTPEPTVTPTSTSIPSSTPLPPPEAHDVVHAVLFYSPTCPHCHYVMDEVLPPLQQVYGDRLQVAEIDVSTPEGLDLYYAAIAQFAIPSERFGVPTMIVGDVVMVGSGEIPTLLPDLVKQGVDGGGVDWPAIPGFAPPPAR